MCYLNGMTWTCHEKERKKSNENFTLTNVFSRQYTNYEINVCNIGHFVLEIPPHTTELLEQWNKLIENAF